MIRNVLEYRTDSGKDVDSILFKPAVKTSLGYSTHTLMGDLIDTLSSLDTACGLAAQQIGELESIIALKLEEGVRVYSNPVILERRGLRLSLESCMSVKDYMGFVLRPRELDVSYQDYDGITCFATFRGFEASVFDHEVDHLNGKLYIDKCWLGLKCKKNFIAKLFMRLVYAVVNLFLVIDSKIGLNIF